MYLKKLRMVSTTLAFRIMNPSLTFSSLPRVHGLWPSILADGSITIGKNCIFRNNNIRTALCAWKKALLEIGDDAFINEGVNICAAISVKIGNNVKIGDQVFIFDTDFHPISPDQPTKKVPVTIGNNVWIGARATILAGTTIGDHSVVGAGAIVRGQFPPKSLVAGNPAQMIRTLQMPDDWIRQ